MKRSRKSQSCSDPDEVFVSPNPSSKIRLGLMAAAVGACVIVTACGSGGTAETSSEAPATVERSSTTLPVITTTTQYAGPPTLAPGETLPTPIPLPEEDGSKDPVVLLGSVSIPALDVEQPVYEGIRLSTFDIGVGHWPGTAMPGQAGNVVLSGHRTKGVRPFRHLELLKKGDEIFVTSEDGTFVYVVEGYTIVDGDTGGWIKNQTEVAMLTLFACHPPGSVKERIVVFAAYDRRVEA